MKIKDETRFNVGDTIWEVYMDDDIGAWNVCDWVVGKIAVVATSKKKVKTFYYADDGYDMEVEDSDNLWPTSLSAANEAKKRNNP